MLHVFYMANQLQEAFGDLFPGDVLMSFPYDGTSGRGSTGGEEEDKRSAQGGAPRDEN